MTIVTAATATERIDQAIAELDTAVATLRAIVKSNPAVAADPRITARSVALVAKLADLAARPVSGLR